MRLPTTFSYKALEVVLKEIWHHKTHITQIAIRRKCFEYYSSTYHNLQKGFADYKFSAVIYRPLMQMMISIT